MRPGFEGNTEGVWVLEPSFLGCNAAGEEKDLGEGGEPSLWREGPGIAHISSLGGWALPSKPWMRK